MATKNLSTAFAGSTTRGASKLEHEVNRRMDMFTDEFSPPGASEAFPGGNFKKSTLPYGAPHDELVPETKRDFWDKRTLAAAGNASEQEPMDALDLIEQRFNASVKKYTDQFPGAK